MNISTPVIIAVPMAAAIAVFFWSLDRIRRERAPAPATPAPPRATPRELVERLLRPAAEDTLLVWPVSTRVSRPANNDADLLAPLPPA